ncbi:hypothetical protein K439DRAFT_1619289 [Ramaria rubella]|nr:hypothetical protein K439DRAFT_1619289 [Ramaria rubella]
MKILGHKQRLRHARRVAGTQALLQGCEQQRSSVSGSDDDPQSGSGMPSLRYTDNLGEPGPRDVDMRETGVENYGQEMEAEESHDDGNQNYNHGNDDGEEDEPEASEGGQNQGEDEYGDLPELGEDEDSDDKDEEIEDEEMTSEDLIKIWMEQYGDQWEEQMNKLHAYLCRLIMVLILNRGSRES